MFLAELTEPLTRIGRVINKEEIDTNKQIMFKIRRGKLNYNMKHMGIFLEYLKRE